MLGFLLVCHLVGRGRPFSLGWECPGVLSEALCWALALHRLAIVRALHQDTQQPGEACGWMAVVWDPLRPGRLTQ